MTLSLFNSAPIPALSNLWNLTQQAQVSLTVLTPVVTALRQRLEEPGALGMSNVERERVQTALANLEQHVTTNAGSSGLVPRILLQPMLESVSRALPIRLNYQGGDENDIGTQYCIGQEVGAGGCSRVFHGYSLETGETVAIKLVDVPEGQDETYFVEALRREYEILSSLPEGAGPRALRFGTMQGKVCLVMEYLDGEDLFEALESLHHDMNTPEAVQRVLGIGLQAVQSIAAIHQRGIVHRDIKPENFRVRTVRVSGREIRAFDFGIARRTGENDGMVAGTPDYMPPESFLAAPADSRQDVFALGATLYWLITGETPYHADSMQGIIANLGNPNFRVEAPSTVLLQNRPDLRDKMPASWLGLLDTVILKALDRDPSRRHRDAGEMMMPLRSLVNHRMPAAAPQVAGNQARVAPVPHMQPSRASTRNDRPTAVARASRRSGSSG